jgi:hypothetical protein
VLAASLAVAATRPHYGGTLRIELREPVEEPDPPTTGPTLGKLIGPFSVTRWEGGRRAVYTADENAAGGRPFVDNVDVQMGLTRRDRAIELGRADIVELAPNELRPASGQRIWSSSPVRILALVFGPKVEDARVREALALTVDRASIHRVLLQRQGEISGALLPQWVSGDAFLFPGAADPLRARSLTAGLPVATRTLSLAAEDRAIAERIALDARDAGLIVTVVAARANADVRLVQARLTSSNGWEALPVLAAAFGLPEPARGSTPEALYAAERALLEGFRVVPLFHVPDLYAVSPRVKGGPGITPLGEWRFETLWIDRP